MIVHPDMIKSATPTTSVAPIPTIIPTPPIYVHAGDTGHRTLWLVAQFSFHTGPY
jgi:hypothetical protein